MEYKMKFELRQDSYGDSFSLVEGLPKNPTEEQKRRYKFMTADSKLIIIFNCDSFEEAMVMRDRYLGWHNNPIKVEEETEE
jgi:hypothetical protein